MHFKFFEPIALISLLLAALEVVVISITLLFLWARFNRRCFNRIGNKHRGNVSYIWTRRKVYWRQKRVSRSQYVTLAFNESTRAQKCFQMKTSHAKRRRLEKSSKVLNSEDTLKGTDPMDCFDVADGRTSTLIGSFLSPLRQGYDSIKLNLQSQVTKSLTLDNQKSSRTCNFAKKSCKKPARVSSKRFAYLLTPKRVKKQTRFRRRSGNRAGIRAASPNDKDLQRTKVRRIYRKKKKRVNEIGRKALKNQPVPPETKPLSAPSYHISFDNILQT